MKHKTASQSLWREGEVCPRVLGLVSRWNNLLEEVAEQLQASRALLQLWRRHRDYSAQCASAVQQQAGRTQELLKAAASKDIADDEVATWVHDCNVRSGTITVCFPNMPFVDFSSLAGRVLMWVSLWYVSVGETIDPKELF